MIFGLGKPKQVPEHEAEGEIERVYHEIKQTLRVTGVNMNFRTWAGHEKFLPEMWTAVRPNTETRAFETAADRIRAESARGAQALGKLGAAQSLRLGESQAFQIQAALDLYHYITPKLLVLTSAVRLALKGERVGGEAADANVELIERGAPASMYPMEMVSEDTEDKRVRALFDDFKQTLSLPSVTSYFRALALWPDYLEAVWQRLKPLTGREDYQHLSESLRETGRELARALPYEIPLSRERVEELGEDAEAIIKATEQFEQLLPPSIITIALVKLDWQPPDVAARSAFPAARRGGAEPGGVQ